MTKMVNAVPSEYGIVGAHYLTKPWTDEQLYAIGIELNWPFPQLFRLKSRTFMLGADWIMLVNEEDWSLVQLDTYDYHDQGTEKSITPGGSWQVVDFWDFFIFVNGRCSLWYDRKTDKVLVEDSVWINSVAGYKGRVIFGGFDDEHYWSDDEETYWAANPTTLETSGTPKALGPNWIRWSSIGGGDVGNIYSGTPTIWERLRGDWGEMPMHGRGEVVALKELFNRLVVYSLDGVSVVSHKSQPVSTLGVDLYRAAPGIVNRGAVAGDLLNHVFVDPEGAIWWAHGDAQFERLGYEEWTEDMLGDEIVVSHNELTGSFYIGTAFKTLELSWNKTKNQPAGLGELNQRVTSCISVAGESYGLGTSIDQSDETLELDIETDELDFERPGHKAITWVQFVGSEELLDETSGTAYARVHYRYNQNDRHQQTAWKKLNKDGMCYFPVKGVDFKIELKASDFRNLTVNGLKASFQIDDRRYTRGIDVGKINS